MSLWLRFRRWPWWAQALAWVFAWPLPLAFWALARPKEQRLGPVLLAVASLAVWVAAAGATTEDRADQRAGGRVAGTTSTTSSPVETTTTTASTTALDSTTTSSSATTAPPSTTSTSTTSTSTTTTTAPPPRDTGLLARLRVAPEGPRRGYSRNLFPHWVDADGDRCDTREEVLIAESRSPAQVDAYGCKVITGDWFSVYDGVVTDQPGELDIDHVVALAEAWDSGASSWDVSRRRAFANDLDEPGALIAVTASSNRSKSDRDPAGWKPPRREAWCQFATDWATVKVKWDLTADQAEVDALRAMIATC